LIGDLLEGLEPMTAGAPGWRGLDYWRVVTIGGHDPVAVARDWTLLDVWNASYQLQIKACLEAMG